MRDNNRLHVHAVWESDYGRGAFTRNSKLWPSRVKIERLGGLTASQVEQSWLLKSAINPGKRFIVTGAGHERQIKNRRTFYESNHE